MIRKIGLYILSLWLLFCFIVIITLNINIYDAYNNFIGFSALSLLNIVPIISTVFFLIGMISFYFFKHDINGSHELPFKITKIENINSDHLTFLSTYIIPLVLFNFKDTRQLIVMGLLLIVMGVIYIRTDLFYANPSLSLLGFRIYKVNAELVNNETR